MEDTEMIEFHRKSVAQELKRDTFYDIYFALKDYSTQSASPFLKLLDYDRLCDFMDPYIQDPKVDFTEEPDEMEVTEHDNYYSDTE